MEQNDREMFSIAVELFSNKLDRIEGLLEQVVEILTEQSARHQEAVDLLEKIKDAS